MNKKLKEVEHFEKYLEEEQLPEVERRKQKWKKVRPVLFVLIAIIILILPTYLWLTQAPPEALIDCGFNKNCFIRLADNCEPALYHQEEVGSLVRYEITGCQLAVSFEKFAETEPEEMRTLFGNKRMSCPFTKGRFDANWLTQFVAPVRYCSGDLKEAIFAIRAAQLVFT